MKRKLEHDQHGELAIRSKRPHLSDNEGDQGTATPNDGQKAQSEQGYQHGELAIRSQRSHLSEDDVEQDAAAPGDGQTGHPPTSTTELSLFQPPKIKTSFLDLPRELRDVIYSLHTPDIRFAYDGYADSDSLSSNCWEVGYTHAPSSLDILLSSKQVRSEYNEFVLKRMQVVVRLFIQEGNTVSDAPWYLSSPRWVKDNVRGARIVVDVHDWLKDPHEAQRFTADDLYACFQKIMNDTANNLPELVSLDVMLAYPWDSGFRHLDMGHAHLKNDILVRHVDMQTLLSTRPTTPGVAKTRFGVLLETKLSTYPDEDRVYYPYWVSLTEPLELTIEGYEGKDDYPWEDDEATLIGWYGTLSSEQPAGSHLGLDWQFVKVMDNHDMGDDDEGSVSYPAIRSDTDEYPEKGSITWTEYWEGGYEEGSSCGDARGRTDQDGSFVLGARRRRGRRVISPG